MFDLKHIDTNLALVDIKNSGTKLKQMICDRQDRKSTRLNSSHT